MTEPTAAEQAAAEAILKHFGDPSGHSDLARAVVAAVRPRIEAEALREFADDNRFPHDWIMFRRNDGSGVTVPDLLREVAAGKLARQSLSRPTAKETR